MKKVIAMAVLAAAPLTSAASDAQELVLITNPGLTCVGRDAAAGIVYSNPSALNGSTSPQTLLCPLSNFVYRFTDDGPVQFLDTYTYSVTVIDAHPTQNITCDIRACDGDSCLTGPVVRSNGTGSSLLAALEPFVVDPEAIILLRCDIPAMRGSDRSGIRGVHSLEAEEPIE